MTTRKAANPKQAVYLDNLTIQLRLLDAFREPGEYAATYAATYAAGASTGHPAQGWLRGTALRVAVPSTLAGWAILEGSMHFARLADITARSLGVLLVLVVGSTAVVHALKAQLARDTGPTLTSVPALTLKRPGNHAVFLLAASPDGEPVVEA